MRCIWPGSVSPPTRDAQTQALRDEVNHKFSVQVAENKRLQTQLQKHSSDMSKVRPICAGCRTHTSTGTLVWRTASSTDGGDERKGEAVGIRGGTGVNS